MTNLWNLQQLHLNKYQTLLSWLCGTLGTNAFWGDEQPICWLMNKLLFVKLRLWDNIWNMMMFIIYLWTWILWDEWNIKLKFFWGSLVGVRSFRFLRLGHGVMRNLCHLIWVWARVWTIFPVDLNLWRHASVKIVAYILVELSFHWYFSPF